MQKDNSACLYKFIYSIFYGIYDKLLSMSMQDFIGFNNFNYCIK